MKSGSRGTTRTSTARRLERIGRELSDIIEQLNSMKVRGSVNGTGVLAAMRRAKIANEAVYLASKALDDGVKFDAAARALALASVGQR